MKTKEGNFINRIRILYRLSGLTGPKFAEALGALGIEVSGSKINDWSHATRIKDREDKTFFSSEQWALVREAVINGDAPWGTIASELAGACTVSLSLDVAAPEQPVQDLGALGFEEVAPTTHTAEEGTDDTDTDPDPDLDLDLDLDLDEGGEAEPAEPAEPAVSAAVADVSYWANKSNKTYWVGENRKGGVAIEPEMYEAVQNKEDWTDATYANPDSGEVDDLDLTPAPKTTESDDLGLGDLDLGDLDTSVSEPRDLAGTASIDDDLDALFGGLDDTTPEEQVHDTGTSSDPLDDLDDLLSL